MFPNINKNAVVDIHTHCCGICMTNYIAGVFPYSCNVNELKLYMERCKVDYSVTFPVFTKIGTEHSLELDRQLRNVFKEHEDFPYKDVNTRLLQEIQLFGGTKLLPFMAVSLKDKMLEQLLYIKDLKSQHDIYGLKFHPSSDEEPFTTLLSNKDVVDILNQLNLPIMVHSSLDDYSDANIISYVAERLNNLRFCVAHAGRMNANFISKCSDTGNVWVDISPAIYLTKLLNKSTDSRVLHIDYSNANNLINFLYEKIPHRLLWGTDYPWVACGSLEKNKGEFLGDLYDKSYNLLRSLPSDVKYSISNRNAINFLLGE